MATTASTGLWLRKLLGELAGSAKPMVIHGDNEAALKHVNSPGSINRTKHVDIMHQFVLDRAIRNDLKFVSVKSEENVADIFTKPLGPNKFPTLRSKLGIHKTA